MLPKSEFVEHGDRVRRQDLLRRANVGGEQFEQVLAVQAQCRHPDRDGDGHSVLGGSVLGGSVMGGSGAAGGAVATDGGLARSTGGLARSMGGGEGVVDVTLGGGAALSSGAGLAGTRIDAVESRLGSIALWLTSQ